MPIKFWELFKRVLSSSPTGSNAPGGLSLGDDIKVLELLPGKEASPIRCKVRATTLSNHPRYEALSYAWGSSPERVVIEVSGHPVRIPRNLNAALHRLRRQKGSRILWIDQLCINQDNIEEKAAQVQRMREIYSKCSRCLLWMGEVDEAFQVSDAANAFGFIEFLAAASKAPDPLNMPVPPFLESPPAFLAAMKALRTIAVSEGPWWGRMWTVQEAILPKKRTLLWGPLSMSWKTITSATRAWTGSSTLQLSHENLITSIDVGDVGHLMAHAIWINSSRNRRDPPIAASIRWRDRQATDPRDNVYALTGLYPAGTLPRTEWCDYKHSAARAFADFTVDLIGDDSLLPLIFDPHLEEDIATPNVPRWALDMKSGRTYNTNPWYQFHGYSYYHANKSLPQEPPTYDTQGTLDLLGSVVDTVDVVGEGNSITRDKDARETSPPGSLLRSWVELCGRKENLSEPYSPDRKSIDNETLALLSRVLLGDLVRDHESRVTRRAMDDDVKAMSDYLENRSDRSKTSIQYTLNGMTRNRRLFITKGGLIGLGHLDTRPGDEVWVFNLGRMPFTIRPRMESDSDIRHYDFMGACYVQGIMQGEMVTERDQGLAQQTARIH